MNKEDRFNEEMENLYQVVGKATGYWANYYLKSVRKNGGLTHAKKALSKKDTAQDGFQKLIEVGRPDLSIEATVVKEDYVELFTAEEINEAKRRLSTVPSYAWRKEVKPIDNFSGEITDKGIFKEGATKQVTVNIYERNPAAREECLKIHGYNCKVCGMSFLDTYGEIGRNFIHVHHIKPLAGVSGEYQLNPKKDLVPVCPNCHSMLHTRSSPLSVDELKQILKEI